MGATLFNSLAGGQSSAAAAPAYAQTSGGAPGASFASGVNTPIATVTVTGLALGVLIAMHYAGFRFNIGVSS